MKITAGMAIFNDFDGGYFTLQSLRLHHQIPDNLDIEYIVVDNNAASSQGQMTKSLVQNWVKGGRYIDMPEPKGTTQTRQRIFDEATGDIVICMDPHVLVGPGILARLVKFYEENPETLDIYSGPMLYDNLESIATHFSPVWRAEMWGIWGTDERGTNPENEPFEVWGQGLGFFTCRRQAWLGFNPHFRGFGGEEGYIHEKFRQAGRKCWCIPWLRWLHRFGRPEGVPYPLTLWNKVRNYVLGHNELGKSLDEVYQHFVKEQLRLSEDDWKYLVDDPIAHILPKGETLPPSMPVGSSSLPQPKPDINTIDEIFDFLHGIPRDINEHMPKLRELASKCKHVTEFSSRRESTVALLAGRPKVFRSYNSEPDPIYSRLHHAIRSNKQAENKKGLEEFTISVGDSLTTGVIDKTDLLFLDTFHSGDRLWTELMMHAKHVRRFIAIHDTELYGEKGESNQPGLLVGLRKFLASNPEWFIYYQTKKQYGLTVISKSQQDKYSVEIE